MTPAGEVLAHFGHLAIGFGYHLWEHRTCGEYEDIDLTSLLLIASLLLITFCFDISLTIGLMTVLELLVLTNSYLKSMNFLLSDLRSQYYFSLLTCSLCSLISRQNPSQRNSLILTRIAFIVIHLELLLLAIDIDLNYWAFSICFIFALFLSLTSLHISGFESIILYWSMYISSDWIMTRLSTGSVTNSLELTNLIGSCGLLSVLSLGMTALRF
jgi:hypothetical protein